MLPDYPNFKKKLALAFLERIRQARDSEFGIFSKIPSSRLFEGASVRLHRVDGSTSESEPAHLEVSAQLLHDLSEFETLTIEEIISVLDETGQKMAGEQLKQLLHVMEEAVTEVGNVGSMRTPDEFLDLEEKREVDYDADGNPQITHCMVGSDKARRKIMDILAQIEDDPALRKRRDQIAIRKEQDWRDREAARKLAE